MKKILLPIVLWISLSVLAQDPLRFQEEVNQMIAADTGVIKKNIVLFTGSSSIRLWAGLEKDFPNANILKRGFGGSEMSDLVFFADKLIVPYRPKQIFIYEGDNDIANGKSPDEILKHTEQLLATVRAKLPIKTKVYFISPKPSLSRWALKEQYEAFNKKLKSWCGQKKNVTFVDVWTPMLAADGNVMKDLFVEEGLHMNPKGYAIWATVVGVYLK
jgi:lysophospholipase L1-like esterase